MRKETIALLNAMFAGGWSVEIEPYEMTYGGTVNLWRVQVSHKQLNVEGSGISGTVDGAFTNLMQRLDKMVRLFDSEVS